MKHLIAATIFAMVLTGCVGSLPPIQYPVPEVPNRPKVIFIGISDEHLGMDLICQTEEHEKALFGYIIDLEDQLVKAKITIEEVNKNNK